MKYDIRYEKFYDAIKARYPEMIIIRSAHPTADKNPLYFPNNKGDILDLHYYRSPTGFSATIIFSTTIHVQVKKFISASLPATKRWGGAISMLPLPMLHLWWLLSAMPT